MANVEIRDIATEKTTLDGTELVEIQEAAGGAGSSKKATTANIMTGLSSITDKNFVTDAEKTVIGNTSGTNTGDQTSIVGITGTVAQFNTAITDATLLGSNNGDETVVSQANAEALTDNADMMTSLRTYQQGLRTMPFLLGDCFVGLWDNGSDSSSGTGGSSAFTQASMLLSSGTSANGRGGRYLRNLLSPGSNATNIFNFDNPVVIRERILVETNTGTDLRFIRGIESTTLPADGESNVSHISILVSDLALKLQVLNGSGTPTVVDASTTLTVGVPIGVVVFSDGAGNVKMYVEGVLKASSSAGPTGLSAGATGHVAYAHTTTGTASHVIDVRINRQIIAAHGGGGFF